MFRFIGTTSSQFVFELLLSCSLRDNCRLGICDLLAFLLLYHSFFLLFPHSLPGSPFPRLVSDPISLHLLLIPLLNLLRNQGQADHLLDVKLLLVLDLFQGLSLRLDHRALKLFALTHISCLLS